MGILRTGAGRLRLGWRVLLFLLLFVAVTAVGALLPLGGLPWATIPPLLGALLAGWALLAMEGRPPGALGFYGGRGAVAELGKGVALGGAVGLGVVLLIFLAGGLRWSLGGSGAPAFLTAAVGALWLFALPAAAEEALLRGYLFQALAEGWGRQPSLWTTSVLFALMHLGNPEIGLLSLVNIAFAGLFLGVVYLRTASLWWATGAHLGWNWVHGFLADLPVSGLDLVDAPGLAARLRGPVWVHGGDFGPEGSAAATVVLAGAAFFCWRWRRLKPSAEVRALQPLVLA